MKLTVTFVETPSHVPYHSARASLLETRLVLVELSEDGHTGRGEATLSEMTAPDPRAATAALLEEARPAIERGVTNAQLLALLPHGAARNAVDAALWDLAAKRTGRRVWQPAHPPEPVPLEGMKTISLADTGTVEAELAASRAWRGL